MSEPERVSWFVDDVIDDFFEILHGYLYETFVFDDETCEEALRALEDIRQCKERDIGNNMYDRSGVQLCWVVGRELRVKYMCCAEGIDVRRVVSEEIDIQEFMDRWPGWCDELIKPFIPGNEY